MMPTAHQVACAIIAACKETGEPIPTETLGGHHKERWRHYAVHALRAVFPKSEPGPLGRMLGAGSFIKPGFFYRTSCWNVLGQTPHCRRTRAHWWSDESLDRVMRAIPLDAPVEQAAAIRSDPPAVPAVPVKPAVDLAD